MRKEIPAAAEMANERQKVFFFFGGGGLLFFYIFKIMKKKVSLPWHVRVVLVLLVEVALAVWPSG